MWFAMEMTLFAWILRIVAFLFGGSVTLEEKSEIGDRRGVLVFNVQPKFVVVDSNSDV